MLLRIPFQELILYMSLVRYILCRTNFFLVRFICCWNPLVLYLGIYKPQGGFLESHLSGYIFKLIFKQHRNPSPLKTPEKKKDHSKLCLYYCVLIVCMFYVCEFVSFNSVGPWNIHVATRSLGFNIQR